MTPPILSYSVVYYTAGICVLADEHNKKTWLLLGGDQSKGFVTQSRTVGLEYGLDKSFPFINVILARNVDRVS